MATIDLSQLITAGMKAKATRESLATRFEAAIRHHIDETARARHYRDGFALAGYVHSTVPRWAAEAAAFVAWRDAVWTHAHAELDKVTAGTGEPPQIETFVAGLPAIEWPQVE